MIRSVLTYLRFLTLGLCLMCMACSPRALREAQRVVTEADSLREIGQTYDDSASLAQSYTTLGRWQWIHADQYAHACYHYGRILRRSDDPVAAMQVFINATHSHTTDNHILGRMYSNMGSICHLAGEFSLSYDLYERCANYFLQNGDTLLYYYGLNEMAFELAEQKNKEAALNLLRTINNTCQDSDVHAFTNMTRGKLYFEVEQYDSVLFFLNQCHKDFAICTSLKACAFWYLEEMDSALFYAKKVMEMPSASEKDKYNMLYIIINHDSTLLPQEIKEISAQRSDIETDILIPRHRQLALAVKTYQLSQKRNYLLWVLIILIVAVVFFGLSLWIYIRKKRSKHQLISQQINDLKKINNSVKRQHNNIVKKHALYTEDLRQDIEQNCAILTQAKDFPKNLYLNDYDQMCKVVNHNYNMLAERLQIEYSLSPKEIQLCVLVLHGISKGRQLSPLLFYAESGIRNLKNRTAKKIGTNSIEMREFLIKIAIGEHPRKAT